MAEVLPPEFPKGSYIYEWSNGARSKHTFAIHGDVFEEMLETAEVINTEFYRRQREHPRRKLQLVIENLRDIVEHLRAEKRYAESDPIREVLMRLEGV